MDLCNKSCLAGQLAILHGENFYVGFHASFSTQFIHKWPVMFVGTIDFYHFIPLSMTLILTGGRKVGSKQNLLASFSHTLFS